MFTQQIQLPFAFYSLHCSSFLLNSIKVSIKDLIAALIYLGSVGQTCTKACGLRSVSLVFSGKTEQSVFLTLQVSDLAGLALMC